MPAVPLWQALDWATIGVWLAAILTLLVLSAAFGESQASRLAFGLLIGATVGYTAAVIGRAVLWPRLQLIIRDPAGQWPLLLWFVLGILLLARGLGSGAWLSRVSLAYLVGVGAALAIGGAVLGTAVPQVLAVLGTRQEVNGGAWWAVADTLLIALGAGGVLFRFTYTGRDGKYGLARTWSTLVNAWGRVGSAFLLVAFGALFATAIVSLLALLTVRVQFLLGDWLHVIAR
jgi:hypothetical protein